MCRGPHSRLSLEHCRFEGCFLVALDGAQMNVHHVSIGGLVDAVQCYAVTARGRGTSVVADDVRVQAWAGLLVEKAASFQGVRLAIHQVSCFGVHMRGDGTKADVKSCRMTGRKGRNPCAFHITDKAHLAAQTVDISSFHSGVDVMQGAHVQLRDTSMITCVKRGVSLHDASALLKRVRIEGAQKEGVIVVGTSGSVQAYDCTIIQAKVAVCVSKDADVELHNCTLQEGLRGGLLVDGEQSRAALVECTLLSNGEVGVRASRGAEVSLTRCTCTLRQESLLSSDSTCYEVLIGSRLSLNRGICELSGPSASEACVVEAGAHLDAKGFGIVGGRVGILFLEASTGKLCNCRFEGCMGNGVEVLERAAVELKTCQVSKCRGSGLVVCHDRERTLAEVRRRMQMHQKHSPTVMGGCRLQVRCTVSEVALVRDGEPDGEVRCAGCEFERNGAYGVFVVGRRWVSTNEDDPKSKCIFQLNGLDSSKHFPAEVHEAQSPLTRRCDSSIMSEEAFNNAGRPWHPGYSEDLEAPMED